MYRHMVLKSDVKVEVLPIAYYLAMVDRLQGQLELVTFIKDARVIAFGWCLHDEQVYHMMYAGLDYSLNNEFDLYFNLMYAGYDRALQSGAATINVGQTATVFKSRMGCYSEPRYIFAKGLGPLMSGLFYYGADILVIKKPSNPPSDIFKKATTEQQAGADRPVPWSDRRAPVRGLASGGKSPSTRRWRRSARRRWAMIARSPACSRESLS